MSNKYQRPSSDYIGNNALANRDKYQNDSAQVPKIAISSTKMDGDFNYIIDTLNTIDEASGLRSSIADRLNVSLNEDGTLKASANLTMDDWVVFNPSNLQRIDDNTVSIDADETALFSSGRRVRLIVGSITLFASIKQATYDGGITSIALENITNAAGDVSNISIAPTQLAYSPVTAGVSGNTPSISSNFNDVVRILDNNAMLELHDTSASGKSFALSSQDGTFLISENTGSAETPVWTERASVTETGLKIADESLSISKLANGTAGQVIGFDTNGKASEVSLPTSPEVATQSDAETGTDTSKMMTPERTKQAIEALTSGGGGGVVLQKKFLQLPANYVSSASTSFIQVASANFIPVSNNSTLIIEYYGGAGSIGGTARPVYDLRVDGATTSSHFYSHGFIEMASNSNDFIAFVAIAAKYHNTSTTTKQVSVHIKRAQGTGSARDEGNQDRRFIITEVAN